MFGRVNINFNNGPSISAATEGLLENRDLYSTSLKGMWGRVKGISGPNQVDIELENGIIANYVPVASQAWVYTKNGRTSGEKSLPPKGSFVFLILPGGEIEQSFVLTSILSEQIDDHTKELLVEGEEGKDTEVTEAGWKRQYDKATGNYTVTDLDDSNFSLSVDKENKTITINDWHGNQIVLDSSQTKVADTNGNSITMDGSGIVASDTNGNSITKDSTGITIVDKNGNEVQMDSTGVTLKTGDATLWTPCIVSNCILSGGPHGGPAGGISRLKGG